ncbi:MAG: bifunctional 3,4-dihydroxy-2-butanone-4-phosphate synthase/GTP cyclohydrolase II, partial [Xenococcaceae cyanobacterium]
DGRGFGLINKLKAYALQDLGMDTVEANERLGFPADLRDYGMGAQMLNDLGVKQIRLITNNPRKIAGLKGYGLEVVDRLPLLIEANDYNSGYLDTKAKKLGHLLLQTYLLAVAIEWEREIDSATQRYEKLDKLRHLSQSYDILLREESRPVAIALFGEPSLIFHLGFDQSALVTSSWYQDCHHPYMKAIGAILDEIVETFPIKRLEFLVGCGEDPMMGLQVKLDRQTYPLTQKPSQLCDRLETQTIYSFN